MEKPGSLAGRIATRAIAWFALTLLCLGFSRLQAQAPLMSVPGAFDVGSSGAATYTIPIEVPPGTAGMEPALALQYSSQGDNGYLGPGWSLSGLPSIQRCPQTIVQDGTKGAVLYAATDRFCLNGERLVAIAGSYGAVGTEYRTEIESFSKIVSYGTAGTGPQYFKVWTKAGQIMEYGNTADSRLMASTTVRSWHVNRIADTAGNYLTVTYTNDATNSQIYPNRIDYTGNAGGTPVLAPYNSVRFEYNTRADQVPTYHAGLLIKNTVLLQHIKTFEGSNLIRDYQFAYISATSVKPSKLGTVSLCNSTGGCLPATTFTWAPENEPLAFTETSWPSTLIPDGTKFVGDFNGDGRGDVMNSVDHGSYGVPGTVTYWMSQAAGTWEFQTKEFENELMPEVYGTMDWSALSVTLPPLDFNGDGYTDVLVDEQGEIIIDPGNPASDIPYGPTRKSSNLNDKTGALPIVVVGSGGTASNTYPVGDIDGDGRDDQIALYAAPNGAVPYYSGCNEQSQQPPNSSPCVGTFTNGSPVAGLYAGQTIFRGDFDGNGCLDALALGGNNKIYFSCMGPGAVTVTDYVNAGYLVVPGDYNGDGKTDLVVGHPTYATALFLSTGTGFVNSGYSGPVSLTKYQVSAGDFNGDGRSDLALIAASTAGGNYGPPTPHKIYLSTGSGFVESASISNSVGSTAVQVQDFNADGAVDLWMRRDSANMLRTVNYQPMVIIEVSNGIGSVTKISYDRLNNPAVYTKGIGAAYPEMDMIGGQYVVSKVEIPNGIDGRNVLEYRYTGARLHHWGRSFLGFKEKIVREWRTLDQSPSRSQSAANLEDFIHTTTYRQDYPYIGHIASETTVRNSIVLRSSTHSYAADTLTPTGTGGERRCVRLTQSVVQTRDLDGTQLPTVTTSYNAYDAYGNPTTIVVAGSGGDTKTTTNVYTNDVNNWLLGRLTSTTTIHALSGQPSITRKAAFQYYGTTGLLMQEQIEPDNAALRLTTVYGRDAYGNITTTTVSGSDITTRVTTQGYDAQGRFITSSTNAENRTDTFANDRGFGSMTQHTDPNGLASSFQYDGFRRATRVTDPDGRYREFSYTYCSGIFGGSATCPTYGAIQVLATPRRVDGTTQSGPITRSFYDRLGRVLAEDIQGVGGVVIRTAYEYDLFGRLKRSTYPYFLDSGMAQWTTRTFDALDRLVDETYPNASNTTYTYSGLTLTSTNDLNQTATTLLNGQLQVYRVTEPGPTTTEYQYTAAGNLRQIIDPAGNTVTHTIDTRGRVMQSADPSLGTWTYQYDVLDQLKQQTDAKSQTTNLAYDKLGRVTQVAPPAPDLTSTFVYDTTTKGIGQLAQMYTGSAGSPDSRRTHTYDNFGRPSTTTLRIDGVDATFTSTYDLDGRLYTVAYPSGFTARYEYTSNQRYLLSLKDHNSGTALWTANERNAEGQYIRGTLGNNIEVRRGFNAVTRRLNTVKAGPTDNVANLGFAYDTVGNLTGRADYTQGVTETFQYDNLNRLTHATIGATTKTVTYNAVGNILSKTRLGSTSSNTYAYPSAGSAKPYAVSSITGVVNGVTNPSFVYDNNGNLTTGPGRTVTWTSFNKVQQIVQGATTVSYAYDAEQQRIKQTVGSTVVKYFNDPASGVSAEYQSVAGGTWHDYLFAEGQRIGLRIRTTTPAATSWQYYIHDHQDSVAVVTDGSGNVVQRLAYDAWGRRRNPNATEDPSGTITAPTSRGYTDHEHLPGGISLINMNGRIYDPEVGRFMSADPLIPQVFRTQALNRYSYVYNNPGTMTDPTGYCVEPGSCMALYSVIGSAISTALNFLFGSDSDEGGPPRQHKPGIASATENWRGDMPLQDVSAPITSGVIPGASVAQASMGGGVLELGGYKYINGAESGAFGFTQEGNQNDILSEVIVATRWTRPANSRSARPNVISREAAERLYRESQYVNSTVPSSSTAEIDTVLNDKIFRRETERIRRASVRAERELGALSVYEREGSYYVYSVGNPDPLVSNNIKIDPPNPIYGRHVFDWHPHPWGNTTPSPADLKSSYKRGVPGVLQHGDRASQSTIYQGVCRSDNDC